MVKIITQSMSQILAILKARANHPDTISSDLKKRYKLRRERNKRLQTAIAKTCKAEERYGLCKAVIYWPAWFASIDNKRLQGHKDHHNEYKNQHLQGF